MPGGPVTETLRNRFLNLLKSFMSIPCMDLRRMKRRAMRDATGPPLDGENLIVKLPASGGLWGEVGGRVASC
jgi:hypothetical protein